jgi:hypothetical protein
VYRKPGLVEGRIGKVGAMIALICFVLAVLASPFKSKSRLEALGGFTIITSGFKFSVHTGGNMAQ